MYGQNDVIIIVNYEGIPPNIMHNIICEYPPHGKHIHISISYNTSRI